MFVIDRPLFHSTHAVSDLFGAAQRYVQLFDRALTYAGLHRGARRHACFVVVGDLWIELIAPDGREGPVQRFVDRFGDHLHGLAFYVQGINDLARALQDAGVRLADVTGRRVEGTVRRHGPSRHPRFGPTTPLEGGAECEPDWWAAAIFTDMRAACGLFEFCEPKSRYNRLDPRGVAGWTVQPLLNDPLGIQRTSHSTIAVRDLDTAVALWVDSLGCDLVSTGRNPALGCSSAMVRFGDLDGTLVEFAQPTGPGPVRDDLDRTGSDILHSVVFRVDDLDRVRGHLDAVGCPAETDTDDLVVASPAWCAGARYGFTSRDAAPVTGSWST